MDKDYLFFLELLPAGLANIGHSGLFVFVSV